MAQPTEFASAAEIAAAKKLILKAVELSELSDRRFAVLVLLRDERTLRRWLAGERRMPDVVTGFLTDYVALAAMRSGIAKAIAAREDET